MAQDTSKHQRIRKSLGTDRFAIGTSNTRPPVATRSRGVYSPRSAPERYDIREPRGPARGLSPPGTSGSSEHSGEVVGRHEGACARRDSRTPSRPHRRRGRARPSPTLARRRAVSSRVADAFAPRTMTDGGAGAFLSRLTAKLAAAGVPSMVVGSFASSFHGVPRSSQDLDLVTAPAGRPEQRTLAPACRT